MLLNEEDGSRWISEGEDIRGQFKIRTRSGPRCDVPSRCIQFSERDCVPITERRLHVGSHVHAGVEHVGLKKCGWSSEVTLKVT